jgi:hypothetical protein
MNNGAGTDIIETEFEVCTVKNSVKCKGVERKRYMSSYWDGTGWSLCCRECDPPMPEGKA